MTRKLYFRYADIHCYNGRARMIFCCQRRDGSYKLRLSAGPAIKFGNIVGDINARVLRGRGKAQVFTSGWIYFPNEVYGDDETLRHSTRVLQDLRSMSLYAEAVGRQDGLAPPGWSC